MFALFLLVAGFIGISLTHQIALLVLLLPIYMVFAQLFDVPNMIKAGKLIPLSPTLHVQQNKNASLELHAVNLFDVYWYHNAIKQSAQRKRKVLAWQLEGLLHLINQAKNLNPEKKSYTLKGTSYFLNASTLRKIGFTVGSASPLKKGILAINFLPLMLTQYLITGKWAFPKLSQTVYFEANLSNFMQHEYWIRTLHNRLIH